MEKIKCEYCGKMVEYGVVSDQEEFFCEECAEYLDNYHRDLALDRRIDD